MATMPPSFMNGVYSLELTKYYSGDHIKQKEMGRECGIYCIEVIH
jgi:hypothetical protein